MIVVDTNVISELMRGEPHPAVLNWVAAQPRSLLYTTHVNQAEILSGIAALPEGRRCAALAAATEAMFTLPMSDLQQFVSSGRSARQEKGAPELPGAPCAGGGEDHRAAP